MQKLFAGVLCIFSVAHMGCASVSPSQGPEGGEGGPCYPNGTCDSGLTCLSNTCVTNIGAGGAAGSGGSGGDGGNGGSGSDCDYGLTPDFYADCMAEFCCSELDACFADETCSGCWTMTTPACDTNTQLESLLACGAPECPIDFCDSGLVPGGVSDPIACNKCTDASCCGQLDACLGGAEQPNQTECLACLNDPAATDCQSAPTAVQTAAAEFATCQDTFCGTPCALP